MLRAVIDTNLFVSGTAAGPGSTPYRLLQSWRHGEYVLVTSPQIIKEVHTVLYRPEIQKQFSLTSQEADQVLKALTNYAFVTAGTQTVDVVTHDPDDNKFIACALEGSASHVVSGDKHLLSIGTYQGISMVTARTFLEHDLKFSS